jgi:hypothetical protein
VLKKNKHHFLSFIPQSVILRESCTFAACFGLTFNFSKNSKINSGQATVQQPLNHWNTTFYPKKRKGQQEKPNFFNFFRDRPVMLSIGLFEPVFSCQGVNNYTNNSKEYSNKIKKNGKRSIYHRINKYEIRISKLLRRHKNPQ